MPLESSRLSYLQQKTSNAELPGAFASIRAVIKFLQNFYVLGLQALGAFGQRAVQNSEHCGISDDCDQ